ncbi:MAG: hypothetical protein R3F45_07715 [Gammaproteobacteria bacterium]
MSPHEITRDEQTAQSDRRARRRHAIHVDALLTGLGQRAYACTIRDCCSRGLRLAFGPSMLESRPAELEHDIRVGVHFLVPVEEKMKHIDLHGRVARVFSNGLGVELLEVTPKVIAALRTIVLSAVAEQRLRDRNEPVRTVSSAAKNEYDRRLALCCDTLDREAGTLANTLLNALEEKMADALGRTDRAFDRNQHVLAISALKQSRANVATQLQVLLLGEFFTFTQSAAHPDDVGIAAEGGDADRPDAADLSVFLALGEIIAHLEVHLRGRAEALELALGQLLGRSVNHQNNPLSAENVCRVVFDLLASVWPNRPNAEVLRDALRDGLSAALPALYDRLNEALKP